ncbi:MAG: hypothetical protein LBJ22_04865 [Synergistaceae bacterium]|jgi:hypothetical protein|nr:hypothetical protein [Synergistaceae bacterium]
MCHGVTGIAKGYRPAATENLDAVLEFLAGAVSGFEDGGVPYDPLQKDDPDITLPAEV